MAIYVGITSSTQRPALQSSHPLVKNLTVAGAVLGTLCLLAIQAVVLPRAMAQTAGGEIQSLESIARAAESYALREFSHPWYSDVSASATSLDQRLRLKKCDVELDTFSNSNNQLRGQRMTVGVRCTGQSPWTLYVPVDMDAFTEVVMFDGPKQRGQIISASDLIISKEAISALPPNVIHDPANVIGKELTRAVNQRTYVSVNMLRTRYSVLKGQAVSILAKGEHFEVRMQGTALEDGVPGERVQIRNSSSGRTVEATVTGDNAVEVNIF